MRLKLVKILTKQERGEIIILYKQNQIEKHLYRYGPSTCNSSAALANEPFTESSNDTPDMIMKISPQGCGCYCPHWGEEREIKKNKKTLTSLCSFQVVYQIRSPLCYSVSSTSSSFKIAQIQLCNHRK